MNFDNLEKVNYCAHAPLGLYPVRPVECISCISKNNRANRTAISVPLNAFPAFCSPAKQNLGTRSELSGMRRLAFRTPIRKDFPIDLGPALCPEPLVSRLFSSSASKPTISALPSGSHFSVLASPTLYPLPHPSSLRDLDSVCSLSPPCVSSVSKVGWQVISRKTEKFPLVQFCSQAGKCFKCGLRGHIKPHCRFKGLCFHCNSPNHSVAVCRFFS